MDQQFSFPDQSIEGEFFKQYRSYDESLYNKDFSNVCFTNNEISLWNTVDNNSLTLLPGQGTIFDMKDATTAYEKELKHSIFSALRFFSDEDRSKFLLDKEDFIPRQTTCETRYPENAFDFVEAAIPTMKPYLTECVNDELILSFRKYCRLINILGDIELEDVADIMIDVKQFSFDLQHCLIGFPSNIIYLRENCLHLKKGVRIVGHTNESILSMASNFIFYGNLYLDLKNYEPINFLQTALFRGILIFLEEYAGKILNIESDTPLDLQNKVRLILSQLHFVYQLSLNCHLDDNQLVNNIFKECLKSSTENEKKLSQNLLRSTALPFTEALFKWLKNGINDDLFLQVNSNYINDKTRAYWTHSYVSSESFPLIDENNYLSALCCGKSINLLKNLQPDHPFLQISNGPNALPYISLLYNYNDLADFEYLLNIYEGNIRTILKAYKMKKEATMRKKRISDWELMANAKKVNTERNIQYEENRLLRLKNKAAVKKNLFDNLKQQMENDLLRRATDKKNEKLADYQYLKDIEMNSEQLTEEKENLFEKYNKLFLQAENKEERANWRLKRLKLHEKRVKLFIEEKELIKNYKKLGKFKSELEFDNVSKFQSEKPDSISSLLKTQFIDQNQKQVESTAIKERKDRVDLILPVDSVKNLIYNESQEIEEFHKNKIMSNHDVNEEKIQHVSVESQSKKEKSVIKHFKEISVNEETIEKKKRSSIKTFNKDNLNISKEVAFDLPKLKRPIDCSAVKETTDSSLTIIPKRKQVPGFGINDLSEEPNVNYSTIRKFSDKYISYESEFDDIDKKRIDSFKVINQMGHSTDSTIQKLLYKETIKKQESNFQSDENFQFGFWHGLNKVEWENKLSVCDEFMPPELRIPNYDSKKENKKDDDSLLLSISSAISRCIVNPILLQKSLIDSALLDYFLIDLELDKHVKTMRDFVLFCDGAFGHELVHRLADELAINVVLHPYVLNEILNKSFNAAVSKRVTLAQQNISFMLELGTNNNLLDDVKLIYTAKWPLNILLCEEIMIKCGKLSNFLLRLRYAVIVGHSIWKRCQNGKVRHGANEICHWIRILHDYVATQVHSSAWQFWISKRQSVKNLDELYESLNSYVNSCLRRCVLNENAKQIQLVINNMLKIVFTINQLLSQRNSDNEILRCMLQFKDSALFLMKVIQKLCALGYQTHLNDLLLRLNFNAFYKN